MTNKSLPIEQILTLLAETPPRIASLTAGLPSDQLHTSPNPGEWSANEILAHLRSCADVWGSCIVTILAEDIPEIKAINPRTWIQKTDYREQDFHRSLQIFMAQRNDLLAVLEPLPLESWSRTATVTGAGKVLERTVLFYAHWLAVHERSHRKAIERVVNTMNSAAAA
jgi:hypothetical protein